MFKSSKIPCQKKMASTLFYTRTRVFSLDCHRHFNVTLTSPTYWPRDRKSQRHFINMHFIVGRPVGRSLAQVWMWFSGRVKYTLPFCALWLLPLLLLLMMLVMMMMMMTTTTALSVVIYRIDKRFFKST